MAFYYTNKKLVPSASKQSSFEYRASPGVIFLSKLHTNNTSGGLNITCLQFFLLPQYPLKKAALEYWTPPHLVLELSG